jgi:acetyltransferase-like isoleucine patch superfamily enzyme
LGSNVNFNILGEFVYGEGCVVGEGSNIIIPEPSKLILGTNCYVGRYVELGPGKTVEVGDHTSIQDRGILVGDVSIGRYCMLSLNVLISSGRHYYDLFPHLLIRDQDWFAAHDDNLSKLHSRPVAIEDDCWLGVNAVVMPGVTVGKGTVVGANSVVTCNVSPYSVVAGAPAKLIKKRLDFVPPRKIDHAIPTDWPYFYSGFEISKAAVERNMMHGGIVAQNEFVICLNGSAGKELRILAKCSGEEEGILEYGGQRRALSNQMQELSFDAQNSASNRFRFRTENNHSSCVVIKSAWIH